MFRGGRASRIEPSFCGGSDLGAGTFGTELLTDAT